MNDGHGGSNSGAGPRVDHSLKVEHARAVVARAESLFAAGNYDAALAEFEHAYTLLAHDDRRHSLLNNIAVCHERSFRYDLALVYYRRYLNEGQLDDRDRAEVLAALDTLDRLLGVIVVRANVPAEVWVDDRYMGEGRHRISIPAGRHVIELRAPMHETQRRQVVVAARQTRQLSVTLSRLSDYHGLSPIYFYVSAGTTGALLLTAGVLGVATLAKHNAAESRVARDMGLATPRASRDEERIGQMALATDVALGGAALMGATSVVLYLLTDWQPRPEYRARGPSRSSAHLCFGLRGSSVVLGGQLQ